MSDGLELPIGVEVNGIDEVSSLAKALDSLGGKTASLESKLKAVDQVTGLLQKTTRASSVTQGIFTRQLLAGVESGKSVEQALNRLATTNTKVDSTTRKLAQGIMEQVRAMREQISISDAMAAAAAKIVAADQKKAASADALAARVAAADARQLASNEAKNARLLAAEAGKNARLLRMMTAADARRAGADAARRAREVAAEAREAAAEIAAEENKNRRIIAGIRQVESARGQAQRIDAARTDAPRLKAEKDLADLKRTDDAQIAEYRRMAAAHEQALKEDARRQEEQNGAPSGFGKGLGLGLLGMGVIGGVGLQAGRMLATQVRAAATGATTEFGESSRETERFSQRIGVTLTQARELENISQLAGVDAHTLEAATRILSNALEDSAGAGKKAAAGLRELGIASYTTSGQQRTEGEVLEELLAKLAAVQDPVERARLAFVTLGRGAKEILPLIDQLDELRKTLKSLGVNYDEDIIKKGIEVDKSFKALGISFKYLLDQLGAAIAPIVIPINYRIGKIAAFVAAPRSKQYDDRGEEDDDTQYRLKAERAALGFSPRTPAVPAGLVGSRNSSAAIDAIVASTPLGQLPDRAGAAREQARMDATEDGLRRKQQEIESAPYTVKGMTTPAQGLAGLRGLATDSMVNRSVREDAEAQLHAREAEAAAVQKQIDALNGAGKAAEDAVKHFDKMQAAIDHLGGKGESVFRRIQSEYSSNKDDIREGPESAAQKRELYASNDAARDEAFARELGDQAERSRKKTEEANKKAEEQAEAKVKVLDELQSSAASMGEKAGHEAEEVQKRFEKDHDKNAMDIGGVAVDPFADLPIINSGSQVLARQQLLGEHNIAMVRFDEESKRGKDDGTGELRVYAIQKQLAADVRDKAFADANSIADDAQKKAHELYDAQFNYEETLLSLRLHAEEEVASKRLAAQKEFSSTFAAGIQALEHGGTSGWQFFKGLGEQFQGKILKNFGDIIFPTLAKNVPTMSGNGFLGQLFKGVIPSKEKLPGDGSLPGMSGTATSELARNRALADVAAHVTGGSKTLGTGATGSPLDANTSALNTNTAALDRLTARLGGAGSGGGGGRSGNISGLLSSFRPGGGGYRSFGGNVSNSFSPTREQVVSKLSFPGSIEGGAEFDTGPMASPGTGGYSGFMGGSSGTGGLGPVSQSISDSSEASLVKNLMGGGFDTGAPGGAPAGTDLASFGGTSSAGSGGEAIDTGGTADYGGGGGTGGYSGFMGGGSSGTGSAGSFTALTGASQASGPWTPADNSTAGQGSELPGMHTVAAGTDAGTMGIEKALGSLPKTFGSGGDPGNPYGGLSGFSSGLSHTGDIEGIATGVTASGESMSTSERVGAGVGTAVAEIGMGMDAFHQFKAGGARGALGGASDVLGMAALIDPEPISKLVLSIAAMGTGLIKSLLGDPVAERKKQISNELQDNQYLGPNSMNVHSDLYTGGIIQYDAQGKPMVTGFNAYRNTNVNPSLQASYIGTHDQEPIPGYTKDPFVDSNLLTPTGNNNKQNSAGDTDTPRGASANAQRATSPLPASMTVHIQTMDAKSFMDHSDHIAEAMRKAMIAAHPVNDEVRRQANT